MSPEPICSTCGGDFTCYDGSRQSGDAHGWFVCPRRCAVCGDGLGEGVMEHPGLGARIHLLCSPSPEVTEPWELALGVDT